MIIIKHDRVHEGMCTHFRNLEDCQNCTGARESTVFQRKMCYACDSIKRTEIDSSLYLQLCIIGFAFVVKIILVHLHFSAPFSGQMQIMDRYHHSPHISVINKAVELVQVLISH